ncbi:MAG: amidohydrolase family protein [Candidatus Polarisedimenticolia bacterium]
MTTRRYRSSLERAASIFAVLSLFAWASTSMAAPEAVVLRCGRLIDGITDQPKADVGILVRDGRIAAIGAEVRGSSTAREIDLRSATCLPGLIDLHAHLTINPKTLSGLDVTRSSAARALDALRNAQTMLRAGFTTLRCPGEADAFYAIVDVKKAIARGEFLGPRLIVAPHALSATGGHGDFNNLAADLDIATPTRVVDGADALRKVIREQLKYGADWIKLMVTGGVMSAGDDPNVTTFTDEELAAAVEETHRHGKKITVHAHGSTGIKVSLRAGVDSIEHGSLVDDEGIAMFKERGVSLVPTLYVLSYIIESGEKMGFPAESIAKARAIQAERDRHLRKAFAAGVRVAFGSDTIFPHGDAAREFAALVGLGLAPMDAIRAATGNAAALLGLEEDIGSLEVGKSADIVAVPGNPLENIRTLESVSFVMKAGEIVKGR